MNAFNFMSLAMMVLLFAFFLLSPVVITVLNIRNIFAKKKIIPRVLLFLTVIMGLGFYFLCLDISNVTSAEWSEAVVIGEYHTSIAKEYHILPSTVDLNDLKKHVLEKILMK